MVFKILFSTTYILVSNRRLDTWIEWEIAKTMTRRVGVLLLLYSGWSTRGCKKNKQTKKDSWPCLNHKIMFLMSKNIAKKVHAYKLLFLVFILWWENCIGIWFNLLQIQMYKASHLPFIHDIVNPYSWYLNDVNKKFDFIIQFRIVNFLFHLFMYITKADICYQTLYWTSNACTCLSYI